jgi:hypothetical protein
MKKVIYAVLASVPALGFAQSPNLTGLDAIVAFIAKTVGALIPIIFGLAIIYFFWGLIQYIRSAGDPKKAAEGKSIMIYGVIAIAVMISIYGLVFWLQNLLGISPTSTPVGGVPSVPGL